MSLWSELVILILPQVMTTFMAPPPAATYLAFHPQDNNIIAIGMDDSTIQIYNVRIDEVTTVVSAEYCVYACICVCVHLKIQSI